MVSADDVESLCRRCRNWGRWGPDDEWGTLNFVTPQRIREAAGEIRTGEVISLAIPFGASGPQTGGLGRFNPLHFMLTSGADAAAGLQSALRISYADDALVLPLQCATQWDGLSHVFWEHKMWNGYPMTWVGAQGARKNAITAWKDRLVGRGVLLDVPAFKRVAYLQPGEAIHAADLDAVADAEGVTIQTGDFVLVRTGQMGYCLEHGWGDYAGGDAPGLALDTAWWLYQKEVAAVATDTWGAEVRPNETDAFYQPWHQVVIPNMGLAVGEIFQLEELARACARDGRYTFFLSAPVLPVEGAVGSPVNPLAIR